MNGWLDWPERIPVTGPTGWSGYPLPIYRDRVLGNVTGHPKYLVHHWTGAGWGGSLARLTTQISSHFLVDRDGRCAQLVGLEDAAWTQGVSDPFRKQGHWVNSQVNENLWCASIESVNRGWLFDRSLPRSDPRSREPWPDAQLAAIARIMADLSRLGIPLHRDHQIGHEHLDKWKSDPGIDVGSYPIDRLIEWAQEIAGDDDPDEEPRVEAATNATHWLGVHIRSNDPDELHELQDGSYVDIDEVYARLLRGDVVT